MEHIFSIDDKRRAIDNLKRAYRHIGGVTSLAETLIKIHDIANCDMDIDITITYDTILKVLNDLTLPHKRSDISLISLGPKYLILPADQDRFFIDYTSILPILISKLHYLDVGKNEKGYRFEDAVIHLLGEKEINLWLCKKVLRNKKLKKEIDISFIFKGFLFVGELKTFKMSLGYIEGDSKTLEYRKKKLIDALAQAREKAIWLKQNRAGDNFLVPKDIVAIVPFVVTPFAEYIWSANDNLWFTPELPRICKPSECVLLCNDDVIQHLANKNYVVYLN